jgi:hypothetical protein
MPATHPKTLRASATPFSSSISPVAERQSRFDRAHRDGQPNQPPTRKRCALPLHLSLPQFPPVAERRSRFDRGSALFNPLKIRRETKFFRFSFSQMAYSQRPGGAIVT